MKKHIGNQFINLSNLKPSTHLQHNQPSHKPKRRLLPDISKLVAGQTPQATQHNNHEDVGSVDHDDKVFNLAFKTFSSSSSSQLASSSLSSSSSSKCDFNYDRTLVSVVKDEEDKISLSHNNTSSSNSNSNKENKSKEKDKFNMSKLKTELKCVHNNKNIKNDSKSYKNNNNNSGIKKNNNHDANNNTKMPSNNELGKSIKRHVSRGNADARINDKIIPSFKNKSTPNKRISQKTICQGSNQKALLK